MDLVPTSRATILPPPTFVARRKAALRVVVAQLNAFDLKPTSFEPFTVAPERRLWSSLHNPQLRSTCVSEIKGVEFRTFFGLGNAGPVPQARVVGHVLDNLQAFVAAARSGRLDEPLRSTGRLAEYIAEEAASRSTAMRVMAIGLYPSPITAAVLLSLDIEVLGDDLRLGIGNVTGSDSEIDQFQARVEQTITRGALLSRRHAELPACGATCCIDDTALRITKAAGLTIAEHVTQCCKRVAYWDRQHGGTVGAFEQIGARPLRRDRSAPAAGARHQRRGEHPADVATLDQLPQVHDLGRAPRLGADNPEHAPRSSQTRKLLSFGKSVT